ncbi:MAG: thiamine pyrophosphate-binding protein [Acidimicrobiales bacterium]
MATGAEHLLRALEEAGVEYIFGVPGGGTMLVYATSSAHPRLRPILVRHEFEAAVVADAYARASGKMAAIIGQGPYIGAYAAGGLMEALTSSSPVVAIGDTSDNGMSPLPTAQVATGEYGSPDLVGILRSVTKYTSLATTPKEAALGIQMAIKHARAGNPGPAALVVRSAAIAGEVDEDRPPYLHSGTGYLVGTPAKADPDAVAATLRLLEAARSPVLVAGKGVHNAFAHDVLRRVAEAWAMPVVTTYKGKSAIDDLHPLALGMIGTYGRPSANAITSESDVVVVVGARLTSSDTASQRVIDGRRQKIVHIEIEPRNAGWAVAPDVALIGDAGAVLTQLLDGSPSPTSPRCDAVADRLRQARSTDPVLNNQPATEDSSPVAPPRLIRLLEEYLEPSTNITLDAGFNRIWMSQFYRVQRSNTFFAPGGMSGMGWALPAALGVKFARPDDPVVAVTGDGGFMMSIHALASAMDHGLGVVCVVMNDSGLGMVRHHQTTPVASVFGPTDHAAIGRGFGALGFRIEDSRDVPAAIKEAQASGEPAVIDVIIDRSATPDIYRAAARVETET